MGLAEKRLQRYYLNLGHELPVDSLEGHLVTNNLMHQPIHLLKVSLCARNKLSKSSLWWIEKFEIALLFPNKSLIPTKLGAYSIAGLGSGALLQPVDPWSMWWENPLT